jgi:ABC-type dipeptide/oligopeptide/nickel transport system permease component
MRFITYVVRRSILAIGVLLGLSVLTFLITRVGGDPITAYINPNDNAQEIALIVARYHLNQPLYVQYWYWLVGVLRGDLGLSPTYGYQPVSSLLLQYLPITAELAIYTVIFSIPLALWLGTKSAKNKDRFPDHLSRIFAISGWSMPQFVIGLLVLYVLYHYHVIVVNPTFHFKSVTGMPTIDAIIAGNFPGFIQAWQYLIGPLLVMVYTNVAIMARVLRSSMVEEVEKDYVITATAKGVPRNVVISRHVRKNALISFITITAVSAGYFLSGAVIVETIFNRIGIGLLAANAAEHFDSQMVLGFTLLAGVVMVGSNLFADILYAYFDPRIKLGE